jgi:hypothetical protein
VRSASTAVILTAVAAFAQAPGPRPATPLSIDSQAAMVTIAVRPERVPADQGNLTYLMWIDPAVRGADDEWGPIIAEEFPSDEGEVNRVLRVGASAANTPKLMHVKRCRT